MNVLEQAAPLLSIAWVSLAVIFAMLWWRQLRTRDATSVDAGWAAAIGLLAIAGAIFGTGSTSQRVIAAAAAGAWSARLTIHLLRDRVFSDADEDGRYKALRRVLGERENIGFFGVYQLQALLALGFSTPFVLTAYGTEPGVTGLQITGIAVALASQTLEWVADRQLAEHRKDPGNRGRTCRSGLWRYSRHPNYFFEWLTWCGFGLVHSSALGWYALIAPAAMLLSVRFLTGVPFTEKRALASRGDDYRRYMEETNAFFPGPPSRPALSRVTDS